MHPIVLTNQTNNRSMDIDILNTQIYCGAITLNPVNYPSYVEFLEYNMSILMTLNILSGL